ncbi:MAG: outer membrane protein assembly factor, partial [Gammaproteobacteria bacterium]|nr:outer membrane protein assembly factor [Gammaproteobacteria bacterium]
MTHMLKHSRTCLALVILWLPSTVFAELTIAGVDRELERNIRAYVSLASEPCDAPAWMVRRRFRSMEEEAREALEPYGYYEPDISSELSFDDACWRASLTVEPGEPVVFRNVDIAIRGEASSDSGFSDLLQPRSLAPGSRLRHADYDRLKRTLQVRAADRGYL